MRKRTPFVERFWSHVVRDPDTECWEWQGAKLPKGYGVVGGGDRGNGGSRYVHRIAYELLVGPIPDGLTIDHLCRNRACLNPSHLEPVTNRENILRGENFTAQQARRTHCPQGHPYSGQNLYVYAHGARKCRTCQREHLRAFYRRRKEARA